MVLSNACYNNCPSARTDAGALATMAFKEIRFSRTVEYLNGLEVRCAGCYAALISGHLYTNRVAIIAVNTARRTGNMKSEYFCTWRLSSDSAERKIYDTKTA